MFHRLSRLCCCSRTAVLPGLLRSLMPALLCLVALPVAAAARGSSSASPFALTNEAAFFGQLDLSQPELAAVSNAVQVRDGPRTTKYRPGNWQVCESAGLAPSAS